MLDGKSNNKSKKIKVLSDEEFSNQLKKQVSRLRKIFEEYNKESKIDEKTIIK